MFKKIFGAFVALVTFTTVTTTNADAMGVGSFSRSIGSAIQVSLQSRSGATVQLVSVEHKRARTIQTEGSYVTFAALGARFERDVATVGQSLAVVASRIHANGSFAVASLETALSATLAQSTIEVASLELDLRAE